MSKASRRRQVPGSDPTGAAPRPSAAPGSRNAAPNQTSGGPVSGPAAAGDGAGSPGAASPRPGGGYRQNAGPIGTPRAGRRTRSTYQQQSFSERHRGTIVGVAAVAAIVLVGVFVFASASRPLYQCTNIWTPAPTASPAPDASPAPGYVQDDMGRLHVVPGEVVKYTFCPPASGDHYLASGLGPIAARFYGVNDKTLPEGWIHNLEHGALVLLYRGDSPGSTPDGQRELRAFFDGFPNSPVCNISPGTNQGPVITRFDDMATPFAALVWGRVLPLAQLDTAAILDFYRIWGEKTNPEPQCTTPSPSPSASPSESPATSPDASPSASAGASAVGLAERKLSRPRRAPAPADRRFGRRAPGIRERRAGACRTVRTCLRW